MIFTTHPARNIMIASGVYIWNPNSLRKCIALRAGFNRIALNESHRPTVQVVFFLLMGHYSFISVLVI